MVSFEHLLKPLRSRKLTLSVKGLEDDEGNHSGRDESFGCVVRWGHSWECGHDVMLCYVIGTATCLTSGKITVTLPLM